MRVSTLTVCYCIADKSEHWVRDDACSYHFDIQSITLRLLYTLAEPELTSDTGLQGWYRQFCAFDWALLVSRNSPRSHHWILSQGLVGHCVHYWFANKSKDGIYCRGLDRWNHCFQKVQAPFFSTSIESTIWVALSNDVLERPSKTLLWTSYSVLYFVLFFTTMCTAHVLFTPIGTVQILISHEA